MLITRNFEELRIGEKFYTVKNGVISLKFRCVKVSEIKFTREIMSSYLVTTTADKHLAFNCVVLESTNGINGYYHFLHDSDPVSPEKFIC